MKVFISWSGDLSHKLALALRDWLPSMLQMVKPYVSSEDTYKGARWTSDIVQHFQEARYGILCITPDNLHAPWICFEAGALSNTVEKAHVCPYLLGVKKSELGGPLLLFQAAVCDKDDTARLLYSINATPDGPNLEQKRLETIFNVWWPSLSDRLVQLKTEVQSAETPDVDATNGDRATAPIVKMLEELLELARGEAKFIRSPHLLLPAQYLHAVLEDIRVNETRRPRLDLTHPVWHDLRRAIAEARTLVTDTRGGRTTSIDEIERAFARLLTPLEYLCDRSAEEIGKL
jgi:hypothetical protein